MHRVLLIHGVHNTAGRANWNNKLEAMWESIDMPLRLSAWTYGGLLLNRTSALSTWCPWYRRAVKREALESLTEIQRYVAAFSHEEGKLSVVGHSFAGQIVQYALENGWHFHRIILLASAMDEDFDFAKYEHQFDQMHIYWSPMDEVIPYSYYGRQGVIGPQVEHARVFQYRTLGYKHNRWTADENLKAMGPVWLKELTE